MKIAAIIPFLLALSSCASINTQEKPTPENTLYNKVVNIIKTQKRNSLTDAEYDKIGEYMSGGVSKWVDLYPNFKDEPFLGQTSFQEGLDISMAYSLSSNPTETLKYINENNIDYICGIPFIEPTDDEIYSYYLKTRTEIITKAASSKFSAKCLLILDKTMENYKSMK